MIQHYLLNKRVSWFQLDRLKIGKTSHVFRNLVSGKVVDVTSCGGLCAIQLEDGKIVEIETCEVESLE